MRAPFCGMANAAPFIARPMRRVVAGVVDAWVCIFLFSLTGVTTSISNASAIDVVLHNSAAFVVYAVYHAVCFSLFRGSSPGLHFLDIRVVSALDAGELPLVQAFARAAFRPAFLYLLWWMAAMAKPVPGVDMALLAAPVLLELGMMFTLPSRQTLSDLVSRTLVVNIPPPQPHRAPAAPMYSATDAEFGVRPRRVK
jgi:uncharacterized RDD family membrane protein YckC